MSSVGPATRHVRALHMRSSAGRHGPERALTELVPALKAYNVSTAAVVLYRRSTGAPAEHPWISELRQLGLTAEQVSDPRPVSLDVVRRLAWRIRRNSADVLHTHDYKSNLLGGVVARRADRSVPWVATVHLHTVTSRRLRLYRALDLFMLRLADRVITVSRAQRRLLLRRGVDRRRIVLMPNVIDVHRFEVRAGDPEATRQSLGLGRAPVITLVGRLTRQKGVDILVAAAQRVLAHRPEARFLVVGTGPRRDALLAAAESTGIAESVEFLGYQKDVASILAASDVVTLPSRSEGHPVVLLEALALARPVVATDIDGINDVIEAGATGWLVPPEDPESLANAVLQVLGDPEWAASVGHEGRRRVIRDYAPERAARRLAGVYRTVVAERR